MYTDEMMHAATKIMQNRADQLGLDDDELMHYGRKGMKWGKDIFAQDDSEKKQSGGPWGNNAFTNAINNPKYNPIKKAQLEKKRQELMFHDPENHPIRNERGAQVRGDVGTSQDMSNYDKAIGEGKKVYGGTEYSGQRPVKDIYYQKGEGGHSNRLVDPHLAPGARKEKQDLYNKRYTSQQDNFSDEDRARGQAVRQQQAEERMNSQGAAARDAGESMRAIREGKAPKGYGLMKSGVMTQDINFTPEGKKKLENIHANTDEFKRGVDYTTSEPYDVPYMATPAANGGTSGFLSEKYGKEIKKNLDNAKQNAVITEQISKYGNQQPEKNDEQRIAEKARGQYIREEQKKQRQDELNKKKQELLEKAKAEKEARENGVAEAKRKSDLDEKKNAMLANVRSGSKSDHGSGYNGSDVPGRAVIEGKSGSNYWLGNGSFNGDDPLEYEYATNDTGYTRRHKK